MSEGNLESGRIYNNEYEVLEDIQECVEELTGVKKKSTLILVKGS